MSDLKVQRRLALAAVLAMSFAAGYAISENRSIGRDPAGPAAIRTERPAAAAVLGPASAERTRAAAAMPAGVVRARGGVGALRTERVSIPESTHIVVQLAHAVSSQSWLAGDIVAGELAEPILVGGVVAVPAGAHVQGRVSEAQPLGAIGGRAILEIRFEQLATADGFAEIDARFRREGRSETGPDAATIAAGTAIGTILGNQARRSDRGRFVGALLGAAAGTVVAAKAPRETIELPAGVQLELTLRDDAEVAAPIG